MDFERWQLDHNIAIVHTGWLRYEVRQGRRYIGTRCTFKGAAELAREAGGLR